MAKSGTRLHLAMTDEANDLLARDPFALLVGMLLDQQYPMEAAFTGPHVLAERLGTSELDPGSIAAYDADKLAAVAAERPAIHRYPGSMAGRIQALARHVIDEYDGDAARLWQSAESGAELARRLKALPGFGEQKAKIFTALLGKQLGVTPEGWREAAGAYGEEGSTRSIADVTSAESLAAVRAYKKQVKAKAKATAKVSVTAKVKN